MPRLSKNSSHSEGVKLHFIPEWAEKRGLSQADIGREIGVDKSSVSRWFAGTLPSETHIIVLAALFEIEPIAIFRHPADDWLKRLFENRTREERERMLQVLDISFPRRAA